MTQRASDLLAEVADRLSTDATQSGTVVAEAVRAIEPELLKGYKDGSIDELVNMSISFLRALFRSLRPASGRRSRSLDFRRAPCGFAMGPGSSWPRRSACSRARRMSFPTPGGPA